jgi:hypothetical protein
MANPPIQFSRVARAYLTLIVISGLVVSVLNIRGLFVNPPNSEWLWMTLLTLVSGYFSVKFQSVGARYSVSETFVIWGTLAYGPNVGTVLVLLDAAVLSATICYSKRRFDWNRTPFNLAAPPLSVWLSSLALFAIAGPPPLELADGPPLFLVGLAVFAVLYFLINSCLVAMAIALTQSKARSLFFRNFASTWWGIRDGGLTYFAGASIAALLAGGEVLERVFLIVPIHNLLPIRRNARTVRVKPVPFRHDR